MTNVSNDKHLPLCPGFLSHQDQFSAGREWLLCGKQFGHAYFRLWPPAGPWLEIVGWMRALALSF